MLPRPLFAAKIFAAVYGGGGDRFSGLDAI